MFARWSVERVGWYGGAFELVKVKRRKMSFGSGLETQPTAEVVGG
jgi:hypothetical protein